MLLKALLLPSYKVGIMNEFRNVDEEPLTAEKILAFTKQKIEFMVIEASKIQPHVVEEEAPLNVSSLSSKANNDKEIYIYMFWYFT